MMTCERPRGGELLRTVVHANGRGRKMAADDLLIWKEVGISSRLWRAFALDLVTYPVAQNICFFFFFFGNIIVSDSSKFC